MNNDEIFMMRDESGIEREARILNIVEINNQEYVVYAVSKNDDEESIFAQKIVRNQNNEEEIIPITDEEEKRIVFSSIKDMIENLD